MKITILSVLFSMGAMAQQHHFVSPQGKLKLIHQDKEYNQTQGYAVEEARTNYVYEQYGNRLNEILYNKVSSNGTLSVSAKKMMTYDAHDRIIKVSEEEADDQGVLYLSTEIEYDYNTMHQPTEIRRITHDPYDNTFEIDRKYVFTYHNGKVSQIQWYWGSSLTHLFNDSFTYNAQDQLVEYIRTTASGENRDRKTYQYNAAGKQIGFVWEKFSNNAWKNHYKLEYQYDMNHENIIQETSYLFTNGAWKENVKVEYEFDLNILGSNAYQYKDYSYYLGQHEWVNNKNVVSETRYYSYDLHPTINTWKYNRSVTSNYLDSSSLSTAELVNANNLTKTLVFPNPTAEFFRIANPNNIRKVQLIDASGKIAREYSANTDEYSVQGLAKGGYIVIITDEKSTKSTQLIIK
ncbi:T9SS type A sorting domain-containing protein [Bergeyella zoohelcum]|uniref:Secretion system C-terminal sorting domain-containing protein n=1 Tax=Bergeyella zoohelcum ATCC 43767 TaxID=883096 RepID=K1M959_9FLAO|nr:T9SS type A sorting domain-containing protein [Bergeyella zoohelcum]EKB58908.1 hypothetical protein HMPREF9699_00453 [Bergeyella zoohelcum ATCC 43767]SUV49358.1 Por secretion system C-terminal sorting domain [Bergeyella zoohelcum]